MSYPFALRASAAATSIVAFVVYVLTSPPSVTFWRPSELAAAAAVVGVPEPPAPALWIILARIASLLLPGDAAGASTLFSSLCSAAAAGVIVMIVAALVERWFERDEPAVMLPSIGGGFVAGLSFAWGDSQWRAATTTSSESLAVLLVALAVLLTLRWSAHAEEAGHARYLLGAALALGLLAGVDHRLLLVAPPLAAVVFFRAVRPTLATVGGAIAVALVGGWLFDRLATAWLPSLLDGANWFFILGIPTLLAILLGAWASTSDEENRGAVGVAATACALALVGASVVLVLPMRGGAEPPTNAYAPERDEPVARLVGVDDDSDVPFWPRRWSVDPERRRYQDRYGTWTPASLDDPMEASVGGELRFLWNYQLSHMYLRYLLWNYVGREGDDPDAPPAWFTGGATEVHRSAVLDGVFPIRYFALPLLLALIGFIAHIRRDPRMAAVLAGLFLLTGVGIVLAISLQQPQPRERDMLYLASFMIVAIWIGIAAASFAMPAAADGDGEEHDATVRAGVGAVAILLCLAAGPINMLVGGWNAHDRSASIIAWEYAYNLLQSCEQDAVLLTAGDNDTFPLLYLQDAVGVRRDVRVVNLRMANDPEYLRRLTRTQRWDAQPLPLSLVDSLRGDAADIDVEVGPPAAVSIEGPADTGRPAGDTAGSRMMTWVLRGPSVGGEGLQMLRLQERVIVDLLRGNRWQRPIYFSASVPAGERAGLDAYLRREGLALRVMPERQERRSGEPMDTAFMRRALFEPLPPGDHSLERRAGFKLDGLASADSYLDPEERRVVSLYRHLYLVLAERQSGRAKGGRRVREILDEMERRIPSSIHPTPYWMSAIVATLYWRAGDRDEARSAAQRAVDAVDALGDEWRRHPHARVYHPIQIKAQMLAFLDDYDRAIETYRGLQGKYPADPHLRGQLEELRVERYLARKDTAGALAEIDRIVAGYSGATEPKLLNNASAFRELGEELRRGGSDSADGDDE
jgi:tetratricopeptide (TPR) repeat protein